MKRKSALGGLILFIGLASASVAAGAQDSIPASDAGPGPSGPASHQVENSVVKVFSRLLLPDCQKPWTTQSPQEVTGSGVVIEGKRILTNAHVVVYARQVQIQADQAGDKISATVESIAPGIDLAVLKLDDESFFDSHPPIPRVDSLPEVKDPVMAYGYPTGGASLSITKGIVSRIEFASYNYPLSGLRIQIDAAINPGNSGGPTMMGDKMIGLAYSTLNGTQNIGYIIPDEEIELFLNALKAGKYAGKPMMGDEFQTLENPALRKFLKLGNDVHGIVVTQPFRDDGAYPLKKWDVITRIGDVPVDDQGMIKLKEGLRVSFMYLLQKIVENDRASLTIVRGGKAQKIDLPVSYDRPQVLSWLNGSYPSYFVYGPLVFSTATEDFLKSEAGGKDGAGVYNWLSFSGSPLLSRRGQGPTFAGEGLVVIPSPLFPHKLSQGYTNPVGAVVESVNGIRVKNLGHLVEILRDSRDEFITIVFANRWSESLVLPRSEAVAQTESILNDNGIRNQGSADMLAIWNGRAAP
jgi:S1-C subfamily serine protease